MIEVPEGKSRPKTIHKIVKKKIVTFALILSLLSVTALPALGDDDETKFLVPDRGYTVDYYRSYGGPVIQASITGDPELSRGKTIDLQVKIANKGVIGGFDRLSIRDLTGVSKSVEETLAAAEMEEESSCTTAKDVEAILRSETEYIAVEPTAAVRSVEELETGQTADLRYTIRIDSNAPAGNYELLLPVNYEFQANVQTTTADIINMGLTNMRFTREYVTKTETLRLPVSVKSEPDFKVTGVSGELKQGESGVIEVTYRNMGEEVAKDSTVRIIVMSPLSTQKPILRLGDIGPGENRTARFEISAKSDAIVKNYGINSEIKYIDENEETSFSKSMKVDVPLKATEEKISITGVAIILIILIALYQIINTHRKRNNNKDSSSGDENE
jgi:hypothetical protein